MTATAVATSSPSAADDVLLPLKGFQQQARNALVQVITETDRFIDADPSRRREISLQVGVSLLRSPTGSGKTLTIGRSLEGAVGQLRGRTVWIWLTPYSGLVTQSRDALAEQCPGLRLRDVAADRNVAMARDGAKSVIISAQIESEVAMLEPDERAEFLGALGLEEPGLNRLIHEAYKLLGLQTYFTVGPKEARAWTIHVGDTAPQAAGVIHTDFERGFIRAQTIAYDDYVALGGEVAAKEAGKARDEGKEYVVRDGDVMLFRFNT